MSDQSLKDFLKRGAPLVPEASPYEYQAIMRRIRTEESEPRVKSWQIWSLVGTSAAMVVIFLGFAVEDKWSVEEELYRDLKNAEWVQVNGSGAYNDWLQLVEYSEDPDEI
jgi:hypothetical protein